MRNEQPTGVPVTFPVGSSHCTPHGGAVRDAVPITKKFRFTATVRGGAIWYVTVTAVTPLGTSPKPGVPISDMQRVRIAGRGSAVVGARLAVEHDDAQRGLAVLGLQQRQRPLLDHALDPRQASRRRQAVASRCWAGTR